MEFEDETEYKKKLDEQKKSLQRQEREIGKFANMDPVVRNHQKEVWKKELEEIERKRTELLPEHQKMQSKSCKVCEISTRTTSRRLENVEMKCKSSTKDGGAESTQYEMRFRVLSEK